MKQSALFFILVCCAAAQETSRPAMTHPSVAEKTDPAYSQLGQQVGASGSVLLKIRIGEDGKPYDPQVVRGIGYGLDEKAVEAVMRWTFKPATKDGVPVSAAASIEVNFNLITKGRGALGPMKFVPETGVTPPMMVSADLPPAGGPVEAQVEFTVTPGGGTENCKIGGEMTEAERRDLLESVGKWRFRPATRDGQAVPARGSVEYFVK